MAQKDKLNSHSWQAMHCLRLVICFALCTSQVQVHVTNARVQDTANQARALSAPHTPAPPDTPQQAVSNGRATAHVSTNRQSNDPVEVLWQQSRPGTFYGRLCNALALTDALAGTAVNAALGLLCNMGSTVVVSDRQTALGVVRYYADNRIGMVTCKVSVALLHTMLLQPCTWQK